MDSRSEARELLVSRRARVTPDQVGLPAGTNRRVAGLRRGEVAALAGVSVEYCTKLERGAVGGASPEVLDALARALRLGDAERSYLFALANAAGPVARPPRRRSPRAWVPHPTLQWILDSVNPPVAQSRRSLVSVASLIALGWSLAACSGAGAVVPSGGQPSVPVTSEAAASEASPLESAASESTPEPPGDAVSDVPIRIVVDGEAIEGALWDNPAARSLVDQLPLTIDMSDYGRQEVLGEPPEPLTMEGMPSGESAPAGTIGYYAPARTVVLYYSDVGHFTGIVRIGQMDGDLSLLQGWNTSRPVTIEPAD